LLVEFLTYQKASHDAKPLFPCIAIRTQESGIVASHDYMFKEINVIGLSLVMLSFDDESKFEILSQYPIPLKHKHKLEGYFSIMNREHFCWDLIPVSE
jgi:hypothetical protein